MADEIKAGDIVVLKSGGPKMTVSQVGERQFDPRQHAWCDWFIQEHGNWTKRDDVFPLTSLKRLDESDAGR
jgi:uncharacterized protein YodC (DUF2158 family)